MNPRDAIFMKIPRLNTDRNVVFIRKKHANIMLRQRFQDGLQILVS